MINETENKESATETDIQIGLGKYPEIIKLENDPTLFQFFQHIRAGIDAFKNPQQSAEDSFKKYLVMFRIGEAFLGEKFGVDFSEVRKKAKEDFILKKKEENLKIDDKSLENEILLAEVKEIADLLDTKVRTVNLVLHLKKLKPQDTEAAEAEGEEGASNVGAEATSEVETNESEATKKDEATIDTSEASEGIVSEGKDIEKETNQEDSNDDEANNSDENTTQNKENKDTS